MSLETTKFVLPNGEPTNGVLRLKSATTGDADVLRKASAGFLDFNHGGGTQFVDADTEATLNNDKAGTYTNTSHSPYGVTGSLYNASGYFDWDAGGLVVGDMINMRCDVSVATTASNQRVRLRMLMSEGSSPFYLSFSDGIYKSAGTYAITPYNGFYIGSTTVLENLARFKIYSDDDMTVTINGYYLQIIRKGLST
jgi:hypothetical protein